MIASLQSPARPRLVERQIMKSSERFDWETPRELFAMIDREFHFDIDVAAEAGNAKCPRYFTIEQNGIAQPWAGYRCWMNPPYGRDLALWMRKAYTEARDRGATVVCLVPARTHSRWFHAYCSRAEVRFLRGRLRFVGSDHEAPFAQILVIFRPGLAKPWIMKPWHWKAGTAQQLLF